MEIKAILEKPYIEEERINFIVQQNHKLGFEIRETDTELQAWGLTEEEIAEREREHTARLSLTAADVERAIYKAIGLDFNDILEMVKTNQNIDVKALAIEFKANNFYRGNPYISQVGALLGFTEEMLDEFFRTNDFTKLIR